ncbi:MAG: hypothetical protein LBR66_05985 [Candidatus Symbiothrix sp.]|jgi:hypothetical protein|nr:hypothetical protein [Candidatus Symbiothrix sp.]
MATKEIVIKHSAAALQFIAQTALNVLPKVAQYSGLTGPLFTLAKDILGDNWEKFLFDSKLKSTAPEKLNHDVLKISVKAVKLALIAAVDYYESVGKIETKDSNNLKTKISEISKQISADSVTWGDVKTSEIIDFDNHGIKTESNFFIALSEKFEGLEEITEQPDFEERFGNYFHIYFSEYLKEKNSPAWIAYEKETLNVILNAVNKLNDTFDVKEIQRTIEQAIAKYVDNFQANNANTMVLTGDGNGKIFVERSQNNNKPVVSFEELRNFIDGKIYYYKYNNNLPVPVFELNEETFDYLTGKIKRNDIFVKRIIEAIKDNCISQNSSMQRFYETIGREGLSKYFDNAKKYISESFVSIIGEQLRQLFCIEENKYIEKCRFIMERTLDLVIFSFLAQLWDDVHKQTLSLPAENYLYNQFAGLFKMNSLKIESRINLLRWLIGIYKEQKTGQDILFIADILKIADKFDENGELYTTCIDLEQLDTNSTALDCYYAEKYLTVFFENFRFLVNYKIASMKKIEYFHIKNIDKRYLYCTTIGGSATEKEERKFDNSQQPDNALFSNAVLLYKGSDSTQNINLFPFVIDYNALILEKLTRIAFFKSNAFDEKKLEYAYINDKEELELEYKSITQHNTDEDMKQYNINCVFDAFRKIQKTLFQIQTN